VSQPVDDTHVNSYRRITATLSACAAPLAGLLVLVAVYLMARGADLNTLLALGYPGVSVVMFFSSATVLLPAPGLLSVLAAASMWQLNPWLLGLFAALGSSFGELTGYLVGFGGRSALKAGGQAGGKWMGRGEFFMQRWGFLTILTLATIPNPFFDAVGLLGGGLGYSPRRFWLACMIGNTIKCTTIAVFGEVLRRLFGDLFPGALPFFLD
jgi:membrane protein DedA with SNARE-associated domain